MRKLVYLLAALVLLSSCEKAYQSTLDLAVDSTELKLPSSEAGYFYLHIASNRNWTLSVEAEKDWLHPQQTSGNGTAYPKFTYDAYTGAIDREATLVISCDVKTIRLNVTQPRSE